MTTAVGEPTESPEASVEPSAESPASPTVEPTPLWTPAEAAFVYQMYDGITFAKKHGFTCLNEFHEDISSLWCTSDDATLRLYLGGDQGGNLLHVSLSSLVENDQRFSALWPEVGLLVMEESELDLDVLTDIVELRGFGELSRPVPMGRRMVHASAGWCVVFTTPGWADGLRQPSFDPQLADVEPRLMGFGDFECDDN